MVLLTIRKGRVKRNMMNIAIPADVWNLELEGKGRIEKFGQEVSIGWLRSSLTLKDIAAFCNLL